MSAVDCNITKPGSPTSFIACLIMCGYSATAMEAENILGRRPNSCASGEFHLGIDHSSGAQRSEPGIHGHDAVCRDVTKQALPHVSTGKLILATSEVERRKLASVGKYASCAGRLDLNLTCEPEATSLELAHVRVPASRFASIRIIDGDAPMPSLPNHPEAADGEVVFDTALDGPSDRGLGKIINLFRAGHRGTMSNLAVSEQVNGQIARPA